MEFSVDNVKGYPGYGLCTQKSGIRKRRTSEELKTETLSPKRRANIVD
jgi:hypothetical protein